MWTLSNVPPEVLSLVVRDLSCKSIGKLWFCGNTALHLRLRLGTVTKFRLEGHWWSRKFIFPRLALEFPRLLDLTMIAEDSSSFRHLEPLWSQLPNTLACMELDKFFSSELLKNGTTHFTGLRSLRLSPEYACPTFDFAKAFPCLKTLQLKTEKANLTKLNLFPALTSLILHLDYSEQSNPVLLPSISSLTELTVVGDRWCRAEIASIPPDLTRLVIPHFEASNLLLTHLPTHLTWLECGIPTLDPEMLLFFPKALIHLNLTLLPSSGEIIPSAWIEHLPRSLLELKLCSNAVLDPTTTVFLPPNLVSLLCTFDGALLSTMTSELVLPATLTTFGMLDMDPAPAILPQGIKTIMGCFLLNVRCHPEDGCSASLPASLTSAEIRVLDYGVWKMPLTSLPNSFSIFPSTLISCHLILHHVTVLQWLMFPPGLQTLHLIVSVDYDAATSKRDQEIVERVKSSWFLTIPKYLTSLTMHSTSYVCKLYTNDFIDYLAGLDHLRVLDFSEMRFAEGFPPTSAFNKLPKKSLTSLSIKFDYSIDWCFLNFSKFVQLRSLQIRAPKMKRYEDSWISTFPPNLTNLKVPAVDNQFLPSRFETYFRENRILATVTKELHGFTPSIRRN